ncbi:hypothetical protein HGRIS_010019 [Hohenbuehelia grisea]|uniref:Uncharacterized protein n=1 Tax=Hohenbuehelia grisea TaxID=104357 RepID=A0ABR3J300_9AGAR
MQHGAPNQQITLEDLQSHPRTTEYLTKWKGAAVNAKLGTVREVPDKATLFMTYMCSASSTGREARLIWKGMTVSEQAVWDSLATWLRAKRREIIPKELAKQRSPAKTRIPLTATPRVMQTGSPAAEHYEDILSRHAPPSTSSAHLPPTQQPVHCEASGLSALPSYSPAGGATSTAPPSETGQTWDPPVRVSPSPLPQDMHGHGGLITPAYDAAILASHTFPFDPSYYQHPAQFAYSADALQGTLGAPVYPEQPYSFAEGSFAGPSQPYDAGVVVKDPPFISIDDFWAAFDLEI